jgi:hypothetical protein
MQDKDLKPNSSFSTAPRASKPLKTTQKWRILHADSTTLSLDNQPLTSAAETDYNYDSVKAFKKLDSKIKKLGH